MLKKIRKTTFRIFPGLSTIQCQNLIAIFFVWQTFAISCELILQRFFSKRHKIRFGNLYFPVALVPQLTFIKYRFAWPQSMGGEEEGVVLLENKFYAVALISTFGIIHIISFTVSHLPFQVSNMKICFQGSSTIKNHI